MANLITEKNMNELMEYYHEEALKEDTCREEEKEQDAVLSPELQKKETKEVVQGVPHQVIRIEVPIDQLLTFSRSKRKEFFTSLIKQIKGRLEIVRIQRRLK